MKVFHYSEAEPVSLGEKAGPSIQGRVVIGRADGAGNFCMRVFEMAPGASPGAHSHAWEHEIFCHSGRGEINRRGEWLELRPGSVLFIPGGEEHQIRNAGPEPLVFVCLIPAGAPEM